MPGRNIIKQDTTHSYYHVYARGANRQKIFLDNSDFVYFLSILKRYLSPETIKTSRGTEFTKMHTDINLLAYCLMENHFHLLVFQINEKAMSSLMRRVMTTYSRYFNQKYHHVGHVFESCYRASRISTDQYLLHISRYIHLNPEQWRHYLYSSLSSYTGEVSRDWLTVTPILDLYSSKDEYMQFLEDYKETREDLKNIKHELANKL